MIHRRLDAKAFTLVELLVVMSIISMLASVVLVAIQGARDKGQVSAGVRFSGYTYHAFGADAILYSDFNKGALVNQSQYAFVGTNGAAGTFSTTDNPNGAGQSYVLDGLGTNVGGQFALAAQMPDNTFSNYTVSM
jgi:prepilin-type N-terminal cleavage/methylation domain-containing protein